MPRVSRKKKIKLGADRVCGRCGKKIEIGEHYLSWSFRYGGVRYRCLDHPPRPSDLTQSKLSAVYAAQEDAEDEIPQIVVEDGHSNEDAIESVREVIQRVIDQIYETAEEYREAAEYFNGEGENAERADELEAWSGDLENFDPPMDGSLGDIKSEALEFIRDCPL